MASGAPADTAALLRDALGATVVATLGLGLAAVAMATALGLGAAFAARVSLAFAVGAALMLAALPGHLPHRRFGAANAVTLARVTLVALLAGLVGAGASDAIAVAAIAVALPALALDGVDGWLARRHATASAFGARFDMETDAALVLILCALAWQLGKAGPWILGAGLMRYAFIAAGRARPWMRRPLPESLRRKAVCVAQIVTLLVVLAPFVPPPASAALAAASLAVLAGSFAIDVRWLARESS